MKNADRLRALLEATQNGIDEKTYEVMRRTGASHAALTNADMMYAVRKGKSLILSRHRVESILAELEGSGDAGRKVKNGLLFKREPD